MECPQGHGHLSGVGAHKSRTFVLYNQVVVLYVLIGLEVVVIRRMACVDAEAGLVYALRRWPYVYTCAMHCVS